MRNWQYHLSPWVKPCLKPLLFLHLPVSWTNKFLFGQANWSSMSVTWSCLSHWLIQKSPSIPEDTTFQKCSKPNLSSIDTKLAQPSSLGYCLLPWEVATIATVKGTLGKVTTANIISLFSQSHTVDERRWGGWSSPQLYAIFCYPGPQAMLLEPRVTHLTVVVPSILPLPPPFFASNSQTHTSLLKIMPPYRTMWRLGTDPFPL